MVLVVHPVEVSTSGERPALVFIAHFQVVQSLGLRHLQSGIQAVLEVVARRLLVGNGIRHENLVVGGDVVVQANFRIEEVERLFHVIDDALVDIPVDFIGRTIHLETYMAILQIDVGIQSAQDFVGHLSIDVEIGLLRLVVVVFVVRH